LREVESGIVFINGPIFQLFAPQGRHFEPVEVKFGMANRTLGKPKQVARQKNPLTEHTRALSGAIS